MNTFTVPTWVKREGCKLFLDRFGMGHVVDATPDDKIDELANALAEAVSEVERDDD